MFNSWGIVNAYGTYASYYMQHLLPGKDIMLLNFVGSTQSGVVLFLSAIVGRFLDAGYSRHLIICGSILVTLGSYLVSAVNGPAQRADGNYWAIWATQGLVSGLGMACFFVSSSQGKHQLPLSRVGPRSNTRQSWLRGSRRRRASPSAWSHREPASQV